MIKSNIHPLYLTKQDLVRKDTKEGISKMKGIIITSIIHNLIREHGTYLKGGYTVDLDLFSINDMRSVLFYLLDSEEMDWSYQSSKRTISKFIEYKKEIQSLVDEECYAVYCEDMEEMGMVLGTHSDNGETYWVRS